MPKKSMKFIALSLLISLTLVSGCSKQASEPSSQPDVSSSIPEIFDQEPAQEQAPENTYANLEGHTLMIYCGAGMKDPFQKIADAFKEQTNCNIELVFANAGQIQTQINTAQEGALFIAGSMEEVEPVKDHVKESKPLVKHIPVLAVQKGNPMNISGLSDLGKENVKVVLGDGESTPIGKLANKALKELGILEKVDVVSRAVTAPAVATALDVGECDAIIVWKENCNMENIEIVETSDLDPFIKKIPAATLSFNVDEQALNEFLQFLDSEPAQEVWKAHGYELAI